MIDYKNFMKFPSSPHWSLQQRPSLVKDIDFQNGSDTTLAPSHPNFSLNQTLVALIFYNCLFLASLTQCFLCRRKEHHFQR